MLEEVQKETQTTELISENIYTNEALENISGLCSILQRIRNRLISEGYSIDELRRKLLGDTIPNMV